MSAMGRTGLKQMISVVVLCLLIPVAGPAQEAGWGHVIVTDDVLDAWIMSVLDHRIAKIYAASKPDLEAEDADPGDTVPAVQALANDETLNNLVQLYGFVSAHAWADATNRINSGLYCGVPIAMSEELVPAEPEAAAAFRREVDQQVEAMREMFGRITDAEQQLIIERLEDMRMVMFGEPPRDTPTLELESLQRWIACDRDERVGAVLDEVGEHLRDGPAALKQLILMRSVAPEIDAAVRAQGFAGGNEWAGATMQVVGALLEAGIGLKLDALDQNAVEYTPEEFAKLLNEQYMSLADLHLAFGARPVEDIGLAGKYRESIFKALGGAAGATGEQT